jgi:hypothetical protein
MAATCNLKVCTGTDAGTESAGDASNWNLMSTDAYDSTGSDYQTNKISVPSSGTNYSYERWLRLEFTGTFNLIDNVKAWHSAGTLSDGNLDLLAGETDTGVTPVNTGSTIATTTLTSWDSEGEAIDITPTADIDTSGDETDYLVLQLEVPDTVTTPGDIGSQTITFSYDES